ncbi:MAG: HAD family phosphatase [Verrucomicrobiae bacterium]|nr:HAD family phosphatase [Verrucomicrobiae bacterium]
MPDAFLFDIGNVIITFDFSISARKIARESDATADEILNLVSPLTIDLELGKLSPEAFIEAASERIGYRGAPATFREAFADIFELNLPMVAFIENLKADGIPLYLLSNTNGIHAPFFESTYPVFGLFDGGIYSHEVGLMKPDPAIYELVRNTLPLDPARTVYIDDAQANCTAGEAAGFLSVPYSASRHDDFLEAVSRLRN